MKPSDDCGNEIRTLTKCDAGLLREMLNLFGSAFEDLDRFTANPPEEAYLTRQLSSNHIIAIAAIYEGRVVGGLTGYILPKLEQARSEFYIYDLAVEKPFRRRGIATGLLHAGKAEAIARGADVVYVQAHVEDAAAVALYTKFGTREEVFHFDLRFEHDDDERRLGG